VRYNIVTEKWQLITPMLFDIMEGAASAINEYQIVVAGGVNSNLKNSDIIQVYDVRDNQWRLYDICLSSPRSAVTMVSSQKDRVMILGGREHDGTSSKIVEEVDFIKRNLVSLPPLKVGRVSPHAFQVNDTIYVFGGAEIRHDLKLTDVLAELPIGEKLALRENRWRDVVSRSGNSYAAKNVMSQLLTAGTCDGPVSLMYE
jgi:hypothetical protein